MLPVRILGVTRSLAEIHSTLCQAVTLAATITRNRKDNFLLLAVVSQRGVCTLGWRLKVFLSHGHRGSQKNKISPCLKNKLTNKYI